MMKTILAAAVASVAFAGAANAAVVAKKYVNTPGPGGTVVTKTYINTAGPGGVVVTDRRYVAPRYRVYHRPAVVRPAPVVRARPLVVVNF